VMQRFQFEDVGDYLERKVFGKKINKEMEVIEAIELFQK